MCSPRLNIALVVAHDDFGEPRHHEPYGLLMRGMRKVGITRRRIFKQHHKAVRKTFAEAFRARIDSPCEIQDARNFSRQLLHDPPHVGDVFSGAGVFELKEGDVFHTFHRGRHSQTARREESHATHILATFLHNTQSRA